VGSARRPARAEAGEAPRPLELDPARGEHVEFTLFWRPDLAPGATFHGPALVVEEQTTSLVPPGYRARIDGHGHLEITRR